MSKRRRAGVAYGMGWLRAGVMAVLALGVGLGALSFGVLSPGAARAAVHPAEYPLRVHVYTDHWHRHRHVVFGSGKANLTEGDQTHGIDFTYECFFHFLSNDAEETYWAKWKKPGYDMEMVVGEIGSDNFRKCELKLDVKDFVFTKEHGKLETISEEEFLRREATRDAVAETTQPEDDDPSHYPMKLAILSLDWKGSEGHMNTGGGMGNLETPEGPRAVDFSIGCAAKIMATPEGRFYHARWEEEPTLLEVLVQKIGDSSSSAMCRLRTAVHTDVYVRQGNGVLKAVSAEEFAREVGKAPAQP